MEETDGGHERLSDCCGYEHLDRNQHDVRWAMESERRDCRGGFQWGWEYGAGESRNVGTAAGRLHTGAGLLFDRRSGWAEPLLLHHHRHPGSLDADERYGNEYHSGDGSTERKLHSAGGVH
jgi:hypothetical protein